MPSTATAGVGGRPGVGGRLLPPPAPTYNGECATYRATTDSRSGSSRRRCHSSTRTAVARSMSGVIVTGARSAPSTWCCWVPPGAVGVAESPPTAVFPTVSSSSPS